MFKMPDVAPFWLAYVLVADVETATKKAESLGAKVHKGKTEIPNMGWFSIVGDPTGAVFALWQTKG
jgi:predicted enzyme related to lactoylglutathione lyase